VVEAGLFQLDLSVFLNKLTWVATSTYKDVIDGITTDSVSPAYIGPGNGLRKPKSMTECIKR
jgi:hypothetical protein